MKKELKQVLNSLTPAEGLICKAVCRGYSNQEISKLYAISKRTVEAHRANIYRKLPNVRNLADLTRFWYCIEPLKTHK